MPDDHREEHFNADAEIVWRLGAELFTDGIQALLELIKNSYDADATRVSVAIDRDFEGPAGRGRIQITDDGHGMSDDDIRRGWLTLSASPKRAADGRKPPTDRFNRVPLGDKGLGRLGAQLLGRSLRLWTRPHAGAGTTPPSVEHDLRIDFDAFQRGRLLTSIQPAWDSTETLSLDWPGPKPWGTILEIEGFDPSVPWLTAEALTKRLSVLINPYRRIDKFKLRVTLDDTLLDLAAVSRQVRDSALARWKVAVDERTVRLTGLLRAEWFAPRDAQRRARLQRELATEDGRAELADVLNSHGPLHEYEVTVADRPWALEVTRTITLSEFAALPAGDCGPFDMELDVVSLQLSVARTADLDVFNRQSDYRDWIRERARVNVYRDGFVVASEFDLLRLGQAFTGGGSYYGLRPQNVMGYVAISGKRNPQLEETTNRQAFRRTPAFDRFDALLVESRNAINRFLDDAGRRGTDYGRELQERDSGTLGLTADELVGKADALEGRARGAAATMAQVVSVLAAVSSAGDSIDGDIAASATAATKHLQEAEQVLMSVAEVGPIATNLRDRLVSLEGSYDELLATAGLGMAAEGLAHDITQVIDRLLFRATTAETAGPRDATTELLLEDVKWAAEALRGQLRHLDPMLRTERLRRETVDLGGIIRDNAAYHRERLSGSNIGVTFNAKNPAKVRLSPGRLSQVMDNLVYNSEYWLRERPPDEPPTIWVEVSEDVITLRDNGPGVDETLGEGAFEAHVTRKHEGRGLGLWLVRQLLDSDSGKIALQRNPSSKRLDTFVITFGAP